MTIYIPLLYICIALECKFFQSEIYTLDKQKCEQEIAQQKIEITKQGNTVEVVCVDMEIKLEQNNRKADLYNTVYQTSNNK
jgi:hypothetical protein